jgi:hypothetical protein
MFAGSFVMVESPALIILQEPRISNVSLNLAHGCFISTQVFVFCETQAGRHDLPALVSRELGSPACIKAPSCYAYYFERCLLYHVSKN